MAGPLHQLRVVLMGGIGPAPFCAMLLADLGADVIRIDRPGQAVDDPLMGTKVDLLARGQRSLALDLKQPADVAQALALVVHADILIEGFRPGVMERLGLSPALCLEHNPRLVYGRLTGWGQDGPLAQVPGHDINFIALTGALDAMGRAGQAPALPLNLLGDFAGGGLMTAFGLLAALYTARQTGNGQVVDAAMVEGTHTLMTAIHGLAASGRHNAPRGENFIDGGAHFNDVYACADGGFIAIGAVEPAFYNRLLALVGLADDSAFAAQLDRGQWPTLKAKLAEVLRQRSRDEWCALLVHEPCCVSPVLTLAEAPQHPHTVARASFFSQDGVTQPMPAPRFGGTPAGVPATPPQPGADSAPILAALRAGQGWLAH